MNSTFSRAVLDQVSYAERLLEQRRLPEALTAFNVAETRGADHDGCSGARWIVAMLCGDFEAAWRESDAIRRRGGNDLHRLWLGENVTGKRVIVRCLHGLGDAIQFLRYLPKLNALAEHVVLEVPPRLFPLAPMLDGVAEVVTWGECSPAETPAWDVQIELMELPYFFRSVTADLPVAVEYLRVPEENVRRAADLMGTPRKPRVGLVWAAGEWNPDRSIPSALLESLMLRGSAEFWSLQGGDASGDAAAWIDSGLVQDAAIIGDGLAPMAAVIANLDLVISVDTLAVHMAGAMDKPTWVLLQHAADWRWMTGRCDSPWYPKARLFRQASNGDWGGVMRRAEAELIRIVSDLPVHRVVCR